MPYLREAPTTTLVDIREQLDAMSGENLTAKTDEIHVDLTGDSPHLSIRDREFPVTTNGVVALAHRYEIPPPFLMRLDPDIQQNLLTSIMERTPYENWVVVNDEGIQEIRSVGSKWVDPRRLVDIAGRVIDKKAPVHNFSYNPHGDFLLDVTVPIDFDTGWGGDRKVGDLTGAGLRITQDLRKADQFHSPSVTLLLHRLVCTNGMECAYEEDHIDGRMGTVDEVLAEFEMLADRVFRQAERKIKEFYDMRKVPVEEPERRLLRVARENGIPDRTLLPILETAPHYLAEDGSMSEFDLVNLITNFANSSQVRRFPAQRALQQIGGTLVGEHSARCSTCQSKLG